MTKQRCSREERGYRLSELTTGEVILNVSLAVGAVVFLLLAITKGLL